MSFSYLQKVFNEHPTSTVVYINVWTDRFNLIRAIHLPLLKHKGC